MQVWQRSNWHWYLKQELRSSCGSGLCVAWRETALVLDVIASTGRFNSVSPSMRSEGSNMGAAHKLKSTDPCLVFV